MNIKQINKGYAEHQNDRIYDVGGVAPTLGSSHFGNDVKIMVKNATKHGGIKIQNGGVMNITYPTSQTRRGRVIDDGKTAPTLETSANAGVVNINGEDVRIRKLTPRECFRLQGFPDEYFDRAAEVNSDSQLYKQAGNSVTVNVIYEIAKRFPK